MTFFARRAAHRIGQASGGAQRRGGSQRCAVEALERRQLLAVDGLSVSGPFLWDKEALTGDIAPKADAPYVADEVVVALNAGLEPTGFRTSLVDWAWPESVDASHFGSADWILTSRKDANRPVTLVRMKLESGSDVPAVVHELEDLGQVAWASPNYVYNGPDPREFTPNDPQYASQYHHPLMQNNLAWDITLGSPSVIIGITDDGVSWSHTDLAANIWANNDPVNGLDDDSNGRIDDIRGWDFIDGDSDPTHDNGDNHGSHVAGIAAARTNNALGVSGTAGGSTIMPIRFYGSAEGWNAAEIAQSYAYGADNGAKIVSTSYNVDGWVGNATFTAGLQYMYDQGVLHFNSAGNNGQLNPPRQIFHQSLFVANTDSADHLSSSSNYGIGVDLAAPGTNILSTIPTNTYANFSGTSMATPNAAGVAALIWSANPSWTRDQVAAQLAGTAVNIDPLNPGFTGLLGHGRVNSFRALSQTIAPPTIDAVPQLPPDGGTVSVAPTAFTVELGSIFASSAIANPANWELRGDGVDNMFGNGDDVIIPLTLTTNYMVGTNDVSFTFPALPTDRYQFRARAGLTDPFGTAIDGDGNGTGGDDYVRTFTFERQLNFSAAAPLGGLAYRSTVSETSAAIASPYSYVTEMLAGQVASFVARATAGSPTLTLTLSQGASVIAVATSPAPGQPAVLNGVGIPFDGDYGVTVQTTTTNGFSIQGYLETGLELEGNGGTSNDTFATAQSLEATSRSLTGSADRMSLSGAISSGATADFYSFSLAAGESASLALQRLGATTMTLQLQDSAGAVVATGAGGFTTATAAILEYVAPTTDTYYVRVSSTAAQSYNLVTTRGATFGLETGSPTYTQSMNVTRTVLGNNAVGAITAESEPNNDVIVGGGLGDLPLANDLTGSFVLSGSNYVATVTGTISSGNDVDWDFFKVNARPGDTLQIELNGNTLTDPFLHFYSNTGVELAFDDDAGAGLNSLITYSTFAYTGDYYIVADSFSATTGTYSVVARLTTSQLIVGTDPDRYSFDATASELIELETTTPDYGFFSNLDPRIEVYDSVGALVGSDDNSASDGRNAQLSFTAPSTGTYTVRLIGASGGGSYVITAALADTTPPSLGSVTLGSSSSTHADYSVPVGSGEQLRTVPVAQLDTIALAFDEAVTVAQGDLTVNGVNVPSYSVAGFSYDGLNHVATWTLATPVGADRVTFTLADSVLDSSGNALDGEWDNPVDLNDPLSSTTAGDGLPGGDFVFRFTSLPGDATRDNTVSGADFTVWSDNFDGGIGPGGKPFTDADFTGDGYVAGSDFTVWADNFGITLVSPANARHTIVPAAEVSAPLLAACSDVGPVRAMAAAPVSPRPLEIVGSRLLARATRKTQAIDAAISGITDFRWTMKVTGLP